MFRVVEGERSILEGKRKILVRMCWGSECGQDRR